MLSPQLSANELRELAKKSSLYHEEIIKHPNCFPELVDWIRTYGDFIPAVIVEDDGYMAEETETTEPEEDAKEAKREESYADARAGTKQLLLFALAVLLILALAGAIVGMWYLKSHSGAQNAQEIIQETRPDFTAGAALGRKIPLPAGQAPLVSRIDRKTGDIYILTVSAKAETLLGQVIKSNVLSKDEWASTDVSADANTLVSHPYEVLCSAVPVLDCDGEQLSKVREFAPNADQTLTYSLDDLMWHLDDQVIDASMFFGALDSDLVLASKGLTQYVGIGLPGQIPVTEVSAISLNNGKANWRLSLDEPAFVTSGGNYAVALRCPKLEVDPAAIFAGKTPLSAATVEKFLDTKASCSMQEIVPATAENADSRVAIGDEVPDRTQIKGKNFDDSEWKVPNNTETPSDITLSNGQYLLTSLPEDMVSGTHVDLSKPVWEVGAEGFAEGGAKAVFGDINADGYLDALVALKHSNLYRSDPDWTVFVYAWVWDPATDSAKQLPSLVAVSARCGDHYTNFHFTDPGVAAAKGKRWVNTDTCQGGPSQDLDAIFRYDEQKRTLVQAQ